MKAWRLRWLSPKAAETAKANGSDSHIINKVERVESEKRVERGNNIDCSPIEHDQLFAQLRQQQDKGEPTYLTSEWEREVEAHNEAYQRVSPEQDAFLQCFRLPESDEEPTAYSASQIFAQLCKAYPQVMRGITAHALSRSLTALGILPRHTRKGNVYHLVPITTP